MSYYDIRKALTQSIIDLDVGLPLFYENADFKSSSVDSYIAITTLMGDQEPMDKTGLDVVQGIYQLSIHVKSGTSTKDLDNATDLIMGYYIHNLKLVSGIQTVVIVSTSTTGGRNDDGWYVNDISITFKSDILRTLGA